MYDKRVGNAIAEWLLENHSEDIGAMVTLSESAAHVAVEAIRESR